MKKFLLMLMLSAIAGLGFTQDQVMASDDQGDIEVSANIGLYSAYVWRGQVINDHLVAQPSLDLSKGLFSLNIWGNYNINGKGGQDDFDLSEVDYTFAYSVPMNTDDFSVDVGLIHYTFPGVNVDDTDELFISTVFNNIILTPVLSIYYDVNEVPGDGVYANLAFSQAFCISDPLCCEIGASVGWGNNDYNEHYFGATSSYGMNDYNIYTSVDYMLSEQLFVGARLQYTYLDGAQQNSGNYLADDLVWGGINLSYEF
jgi:uncharacterized protein (TIGR02001 family)